MTLQGSDIPEFDDVRQHHDALMELGRLELMAEEIRSQGSTCNQTELLSSIEQHMQELDQALGGVKA